MRHMEMQFLYLFPSPSDKLTGYAHSNLQQYGVTVFCLSL